MEKHLVLFGVKKRVAALSCVAFEENVLCQVTFMCYVCVRNSCRSSTRGEGFYFWYCAPRLGTVQLSHLVFNSVATRVLAKLSLGADAR